MTTNLTAATPLPTPTAQSPAPTKSALRTTSVAVLADIHSNHIALERCLAHAIEQGADHFVFLGDYVSDCPYPQKTLQVLRRLSEQYACYFIRGNREEYILDYHRSAHKNWKYVSASGSLLYTYENLTAEDLAFFDSLPNCRQLTIADCPPLTICHGSPRGSRELLYAEGESTKEALESLETEVLLCAHSHIQYSWEYNGKKVINPGATGVPERHGGRSQYTILRGDSCGWQPEFYQLIYDLEAELQEFQDSGLDQLAPYWARMTREMMTTGINHMAPVAHRVGELCQGHYEWPDYPDRYWEQALMELWPDISAR